MTLQYCPLHVHSDASLDGAGTVQTLVNEAKRLGMEALALTDHGTLANAVAFSTACEDAGIKPILGMEAYLMYNAKRHHITLLSTNEEGFNNLVWHDSQSHAYGYTSGYPLLTLDNLGGKPQGIIALTGCASSAMYEGEMSNAYNYVSDLKDVFGKSNVFLETMFVGSHNTWERPLEIARFTGTPFVITNDTHYPCQNQFHAHQTITSARRGFTYDSKELWLKSGDEIWQTGKRFIDEGMVTIGLTQSLSIADRCEAWSMKAPPSLPHIKDAALALEGQLLDALKRDVGLKGQQKVRLARLRYEFRILLERGFLDYIYILWDIVSWAKGEGIYVGPGRGSGGGSYVLYLLGVTSIDPIDHSLVFERFLNPSRSDYPDVDVDFESERRQEVLDYAGNRWGTIPIATYSCYSHKSAVHDIARVLSIPKDLETPAAEDSSDGEVFTEFINSHPAARTSYQTMLGQIRHRGKHAAGVIIPNRPVPIERAGDHLVAAWAEGMNTKDLSKVGIVKYDLLSLTALSQLRMMAELTGTIFPLHWDYTDPNVYSLFCQGDVNGIFQWTGSEGIRDLTVAIQPQNFYDLTTCNALYRPGALDAGTAKDYPMYMKEPRKLHPRIDQHLEKTYGVICYQEQVMAVVAEVMGGDLAQADLARRLISKAAVGDLKWESEIAGLYASFVMRGEEQGFALDLLDKLWHEVYTHSGYSYNLCCSGSTVVERNNAGKWSSTPFITLAELYKAWSSKTSWGKKLRRNGIQIMCLCEDGKIRPRTMKAIHHNGKRQTFRATLANGMFIDVTHNHRLLSTEGYRRLDDLKIGDKILVEGGWTRGRRPQHGRYVRKAVKEQVKERASGKCEHCGRLYDGSSFEFAHIVEYINTPENILWLCNSCHKLFDTKRGQRPPRWAHGRNHTTSAIISIQPLEIEDVYDVEMAEEPHNFIANGIVSHNSHASAYTMISYQMAWYKVYHRNAFTVAMLQYDTANAQTYIIDAVEHGLEIKMPHVSYSHYKDYELTDRRIYLPLNNIAFIGDKAAQVIYEKNKEVLGFNFYEEFGKMVPKKIVNNRSKGMLERIGAFAGLEGDPASIIDNYVDLPLKGKYETQLEILGYIVPTKEMVEKIKALRALPARKDYLRFAGFIREIKKKTSSHGDYWVYNLSPEGSFWSRTERPALKVGKLVSGTKSRFGHSNDVKSYRLGE